MIYVVQDFSTAIEALAPLELAMEWDNVGLQIGAPQSQVKTILVTLTVTMDTVQIARAQGVDLIVAHHPVIFKPLRQIRTDHPEGTLLNALLRHDISVYVAHTNLDQAAYGLNYWLAREVGLENSRVLIPVHGSTDAGLGRIGDIAPIALGDFAEQLEGLWGDRVRVVGDGKQTIARVALVGGSGGDFVQQAKDAGADVLVTGDVSYHDAMDARSVGLAVLDAGHFATERVMVSEVAQYLEDRFENVHILQDRSTNPFSF